MIRHVLEDFEGYVSSGPCEDGTFWVTVIDLDEDEEFMQVIIEKIPTEEHKYIKLGAYFYWTIYNDGTYDFKFSRKVWTQEQIDEAYKQATEMAKIFKLTVETE